MRLLLLLVLFYFCGISLGFQCRNEQNEEFDWYVLYKLPMLVKEKNGLIKSGVGYMYITSQTVGNDWIFSQIGINDSKSIPALTLTPLYQPNTSYVLYNDQPPDQRESPRGHTKGSVLLNATHGFWLVHSVPHFPKTGSAYTYPASGSSFGQSFLCLSLSSATVNTLSKQLIYNEPHIFSKYVDSSLAKIAPDFAAWDNNWSIPAPFYQILNLSTVGGELFTNFAKSKNFDQDLYVDLVAPELKVNLYTETWQNGAGKMKSNCSRNYEVDNIQGVYFEKYSLRFRSSFDHSKWAVSYKKYLHDIGTYTCIGDINRADHQKLRGGGTVCTNNSKLWPFYMEIATTIEPCTKKVYSNDIF